MFSWAISDWNDIIYGKNIFIFYKMDCFLMMHFKNKIWGKFKLTIYIIYTWFGLWMMHDNDFYVGSLLEFLNIPLTSSLNGTFSSIYFVINASYFKCYSFQKCWLKMHRNCFNVWFIWNRQYNSLKFSPRFTVKCHLYVQTTWAANPVK